ncbi:MAG: hypothetical protein GY940_12370 [bacterium]|nr:hypothetical protein [bacterium]
MNTDRQVIAKGLPVSAGQASGVVKWVKSPADANKIKETDIMVVSHSNPAFAIGVMNAAGLICEGGGMLTHICIVAKEMGIPCLAQVETAGQVLEADMAITMDAAEGVIYE